MTPVFLVDPRMEDDSERVMEWANFVLRWKQFMKDSEVRRAEKNLQKMKKAPFNTF